MVPNNASLWRWPVSRSRDWSRSSHLRDSTQKGARRGSARYNVGRFRDTIVTPVPDGLVPLGGRASGVVDPVVKMAAFHDLAEQLTGVRIPDISSERREREKRSLLQCSIGIRALPGGCKPLTDHGREDNVAVAATTAHSGRLSTTFSRAGRGTRTRELRHLARR